jgi:hypothetical protein
MAVQREIVYIGYNNTIEIQLYIEDDDGKREALLDAVTRMTLSFGDTTIDSDTEGEGANQPFNWHLGNGKVIFDFGNLDPALPVGGYTSTLIVYAPDHSDGVIWGTIKTKVI